MSKWRQLYLHLKEKKMLEEKKKAQDSSEKSQGGGFNSFMKGIYSKK